MKRRILFFILLAVCIILSAIILCSCTSRYDNETDYLIVYRSTLNYDEVDGVQASDLKVVVCGDEYYCVPSWAACKQPYYASLVARNLKTGQKRTICRIGMVSDYRAFFYDEKYVLLMYDGQVKFIELASAKVLQSEVLFNAPVEYEFFAYDMVKDVPYYYTNGVLTYVRYHDGAITIDVFEKTDRFRGTYEENYIFLEYDQESKKVVERAYDMATHQRNDEALWFRKASYLNMESNWEDMEKCPSVLSGDLYSCQCNCLLPDGLHSHRPIMQQTAEQDVVFSLSDAVARSVADAAETGARNKLLFSLRSFFHQSSACKIKKQKGGLFDPIKYDHDSFDNVGYFYKLDERIERISQDAVEPEEAAAVYSLFGFQNEDTFLTNVKRIADAHKESLSDPFIAKPSDRLKTDGAFLTENGMLLFPYMIYEGESKKYVWALLTFSADGESYLWLNDLEIAKEISSKRLVLVGRCLLFETSRSFEWKGEKYTYVAAEKYRSSKEYFYIQDSHGSVTVIDEAVMSTSNAFASSKHFGDPYAIFVSNDVVILKFYNDPYFGVEQYYYCEYDIEKNVVRFMYQSESDGQLYVFDSQ